MSIDRLTTFRTLSGALVMSCNSMLSPSGGRRFTISAGGHSH